MKLPQAHGCLEQLFAFIKGAVPLLEQSVESTAETEQKVAATEIKSEKTSAEEKNKKQQIQQGVEDI